MQQPGPLFHKPKSIIAARNLFYASLFLGAVGAALYYFTPGIKHSLPILEIVILILGLAVIIFLIRQVGLRKKWARTILLLIVIYMLSSLYFLFRKGSDVGILEIVVSVFRQVLEIIGIAFLYRRESNLWFNTSQSV
jgi:hypothetical protein